MQGMVIAHPNPCFSATDTSPIKGKQSSGTIKYDYLVYAVGAETQTFNIPGVKEHSCFMKEIKDAEKVSVGRFIFGLFLTFLRAVNSSEQWSWIVGHFTKCIDRS